MQVLYDEDVASHIAPKPCVVTREGQGEASAGDRAGWPSSRESANLPDADGVTNRKATRPPRYGEVRLGPAWSETPACMDAPSREPGDPVADRRCCAPSAAAGRLRPKPAMNGQGSQTPP